MYEDATWSRDWSCGSSTASRADSKTGAGADAGRSDQRRTMRDHAQRAVRCRSGLARQGVVHVDCLHEAESRHHQHEQQRRAFLEQRAIELVKLRS